MDAVPTWADVHNTVAYVAMLVAGLLYRYINQKFDGKVADLERRLRECEDRHVKKDAEDAK